MRSFMLVAATAVLVACLAGCSSTPATDPTPKVNAAGCDITKAPTTAISSSGSPYALPSGSIHLKGSGSSFVGPLMDKWRGEYNGAHSNIQIDYTPSGSGQGLKDITAKAVAFAGSDAPLKAADKTAAPGLLQFPDSLGPIALIINGNGIPNCLHLTGEVLGKIFTGSVTRWNAKEIADLNKGSSLPDQAITIVVRSDGSGTTFAFTDFLGKASTTWAGAMGAAANKAPDWKKSTATQVSGEKNAGVAKGVADTPYSIGYVDLAFAAGKTVAAIENKAGEFVAPSPYGAAQAAAAAANSLPAPDGDWSAVSIANVDGQGAYPISTFTYIFAYQHLSAYGSSLTADDQAGMRAFLWYDLHEGQSMAAGLYYAPLPPTVVTLGETALGMMGA